MFILKKGHQPGVYVPLRALFLVFCLFFLNLNFVFFQALLISTYVDSRYLMRVTLTIDFTFSDGCIFL